MPLIASTPDGWFMQCAGCNSRHFLPGERGWAFNGDVAAPTFVPSFLLRWEYGEKRTPRVCHFVITAGMIFYCADSTHALAGKTLPMVPVCPFPLPSGALPMYRSQAVALLAALALDQPRGQAVAVAWHAANPSTVATAVPTFDDLRPFLTADEIQAHDGTDVVPDPPADVPDAPSAAPPAQSAATLPPASVDKPLPVAVVPHGFNSMPPGTIVTIQAGNMLAYNMNGPRDPIAGDAHTADLPVGTTITVESDGWLTVALPDGLKHSTGHGFLHALSHLQARVEAYVKSLVDRM